MHMIYAPFLMGLVILLTACEEDEPILTDNAAGESAISRREKIQQLEADLEVAKWENIRLSLKIRKVDGSSLVRDKKTNLWHYDVERTPFTGRAVEEYENGSPRAIFGGIQGWNGKILVSQWSA